MRRSSLRGEKVEARGVFRAEAIQRRCREKRSSWVEFKGLTDIQGVGHDGYFALESRVSLPAGK